MSNLDNLIIVKISKLKECNVSLATGLELDSPQKCQEISFAVRDAETLVSYDSDLLPDFSGYLKRLGYESMEVRGESDERGFDTREWPFAFDRQEAFFLTYPVSYLGLEQRFRLGITFIQEHPKKEEIEKEVPSYFDKFEKV